MAMDEGCDPVASSGPVNDTGVRRFMMEKYATLEAPPPGLELTTASLAVPGLAIFAAGTVACNVLLLTKVVASGLVFQVTVAEERNPVPFTVRVKAAPPGTAPAGTNG